MALAYTIKQIHTVAVFNGDIIVQSIIIFSTVCLQTFEVIFKV